MKSLILSRLWMLIGIIILTTGQAWAQTATTQKVFTAHPINQGGLSI